jgi:hypothetical protein
MEKKKKKKNTTFWVAVHASRIFLCSGFFFRRRSPHFGLRFMHPEHVCVLDFSLGEEHHILGCGSCIQNISVFWIFL